MREGLAGARTSNKITRFVVAVTARDVSQHCKQRNKGNAFVSDKFQLMRDHVEISEMAYLACVS